MRACWPLEVLVQEHGCPLLVEVRYPDTQSDVPNSAREHPSPTNTNRSRQTQSSTRREAVLGTQLMKYSLAVFQEHDRASLAIYVPPDAPPRPVCQTMFSNMTWGMSSTDDGPLTEDVVEHRTSYYISFFFVLLIFLIIFSIVFDQILDVMLHSLSSPRREAASPPSP
jgi:hypothetical protein